MRMGSPQLARSSPLSAYGCPGILTVTLLGCSTGSHTPHNRVLQTAGAAFDVDIGQAYHITAEWSLGPLEQSSLQIGRSEETSRNFFIHHPKPQPASDHVLVSKAPGDRDIAAAGGHPTRSVQTALAFLNPCKTDQTNPPAKNQTPNCN
ncbi:uncharacterized protein P884DRAFT_271809 [Thermothelomyces heterothallicus CBS 202.75]|uniref:uncharacterized protein n=1 Tax=Thermothelomyces heterothallicus CBS 202.75 TaxID=1149848 RepID=UPI0037447A5D